jgi:hypothetical protein
MLFSIDERRLSRKLVSMIRLHEHVVAGPRMLEGVHGGTLFSMHA